jgi:CHRD domain
MRKLVLALTIAVVAALAVAGAVAFAHGDKGNRNFSTKLNGYNEVNSKSTPASGKFRARIENGGSRIHYKLTLQDFTESPAVVAHIHFSQQHVNGDVVAFLCGGGGKPACPNPGGTVEGDIVAANVQATTQGIAAGELAELIRAMRAGATYVNVHTDRFTGGEIRGQISKGHGHDRGHDNK